MDKDFLIVSEEWHDGLHCPTQDGTPGGVFRFRLTALTIPIFSRTIFVFIYIFFKWFLFNYLWLILKMFSLLMNLQISILQPPISTLSTSMI